MSCFIAFYSYKGGVGRTLALANLGYSLALHGKRVVLVDMDLEAPALHTFPELLPPKTRPREGLVEYASAYARSGRCPPIDEYLLPCPDVPGAGRLWLMPAGKMNERYVAALDDLCWKRLHPRRAPRPSSPDCALPWSRPADPITC